MINRRLLTSTVFLLVLAACSSGQQPSARENKVAQAGQPGATAVPSAPFYREGLSGVDFSGLDSVQKERVLQILNGNRCDCGCGMTIAQCRVEDKTCPRSPGLAAAVVNAVRSGQTDQQAVATLKSMASQRADAAAAGTPPPALPVQKVDIPISKSPSAGPDGAPVTVVLFSDFQCPYCQRAVAVVKKIETTYPQDVRVVFKHFPLPFHSDAKPAAIAAVAAQKQNKFWEMHDLLFNNQRILDAASVRRYAESLGLEMAAFDAAIADPETARFVDQEIMDGQKSGVQGTPTFFINGVQAPSWEMGTVQKMIDAARSGGDIGAIAGQIRAEQAAQQAKAQANRQQPPPVDYNKVYQIDPAESPVKGPPSAPVTIVEFSDYQCPFCAGAEPLIRQVLEAYPKQVRLVYKQFPLSFHQNARPASEAALFAKKEGKFWEMHELLFKNSSNLTMDTLKSLARQVGLDERALEGSVASQAFKQEIDRDIEEGKKAAVTGTPTIFVNGKRLRDRSMAGFKAMIDAALAAQGSPSASSF